jgi:Putative antitoxin of bacterial toxin-antitoxin system, YdaS/YdaT
MSLPTVASNDCPQPPGFHASLSTLILHEACQTAGGIDALAKLLGVSSACLNRWLEGEEEAPAEIHQACIYIVLLHERQEK